MERDSGEVVTERWLHVARQIKKTQIKNIKGVGPGNLCSLIGHLVLKVQYKAICL